MRNLKRALSLALASIMVVGMMVVGAGAASYDKFTDKADIVNKDAVSRVTELGIIAGLTDGSFGPTKNIDRASFARLICVALNGGKEPLLGDIKTTFSDTKGNWAEKYIAYCVEKGIIAGKGNNMFAPSANVTGSEAAKMLLVALGYNASYENIGGSTWQITTDVLANQAGLYNKLTSMNTSTALTRDNAAQMISNALDATMVKYEMVTGVSTTGQVTITPQRVNKTKTVNGTSSAVTMLEDAFNAIKVEGIVTANEFADLTASSEKGSALDAGKTRISVTNTEDQSIFKSGTYSVATDETVLGRTVALYVKNDASNSSKATVLGTVIVDEDNVVAVKAAQKDLDKLADDNDLKMVSTTKVIVNYSQPIEWSKLTKDQKDSAALRGVEKVLIDNNDDGDVDYALVNTLFFGQVTKYSTSSDGSITIDCGVNGKLTADDKKDVAGFEDVKKDDYVLAAWIGGDLVVEKAESVTGTLTAYKSTETVTVDGTKYDVSKVGGFIGGTDGVIAAIDVTSSNLDNKATFYLDLNGMVVAVGDAVENSYNYAYVWATDLGNSVDSNRVKVTLQDGTTKTYDLAEKSTVKALTTDTTGTDSRVYAYTINSDNEIKLTAPTSTAKGASVSFSKNKTALTGLTIDDAKKQTSYASSNTAFFYVSLKADGKTIDSVSVYTGYSNAISATSVKAEAAYNTGAKMVAVSLTGTAINSKDVADHLYVTDILGHSSKQTTVKAILPGTDTEVEIQVDDSSFDGIGVYLFSKDSKGIYTLNKATDGTNFVEIKGTKSVTNISNSTLVVYNTSGSKTSEYKVTSNTVLVQLDKKGDFDTATVGKLPSNTDKGQVISVLVNGDDELLMIVQQDEATADTTNPTNPGDFKGETTLALDNAKGTATFTYYKDAPSAQTVANMLKATDSNIVSISGSDFGHDKKITVNYKDGSTLPLTIKLVEMFKVSYNGTVVGYSNTTSKDVVFTATADKSTVIVGATAAAAKYTATSGKITVPKADISADLVLVDAFQITDQTTATLSFGTTAEKAKDSADITEGTTYVAKDATVFVATSAAVKKLTSTDLKLVEVTAPSDGAKAVYSFVMPGNTVAAGAITEAAK